MIRVEKLSLSYRGGLAALRSIDLHISPREDIALIGANGSGKTTLAHCLNGLLQPQTGRVLVDGMDASDPTQLRTIRQLVGMVSQNPDDQLVATTVADELAFGLENLALASDADPPPRRRNTRRFRPRCLSPLSAAQALRRRETARSYCRSSGDATALSHLGRIHSFARP